MKISFTGDLCEYMKGFGYDATKEHFDELE